MFISSSCCVCMCVHPPFEQSDRFSRNVAQKLRHRTTPQNPYDQQCVTGARIYEARK